MAAATRLRTDWDCAERGLVRGSDWASPPNGATARATNGAEAAMVVRCDARRNVDEALAKLAPALRRVVERVCLREQGLEAMERGESWPARSGKVALKLALSQLAASF
jgi:DNA-directed RNA polymerase specialized sigma24 family protein